MVKAIRAPTERIPSPPDLMSSRITACPNGDKRRPVSTTISPVTHTALVAVNRASRAEADTGRVRDRQGEEHGADGDRAEEPEQDDLRRRP